MASIIYILLVTVGIAVPLVENAPSSIVKGGSNDELRKRLVFIDSDTVDAINSNSQSISEARLPLAPHQTKSNVAKSRIFAKSVSVQNDPPTVDQPSITTHPQLKGESQVKSGSSSMSDERQIWGIAVENHDFEEDESYFNRPLSLPKNVVKIPSQVKHQVTGVTQVLNVNNVQKPSECDLAIVFCCTTVQIKECFRSRGCVSATEDSISRSCNSDSVNRVLKNLAKYYKRDS